MMRPLPLQRIAEWTGGVVRPAGHEDLQVDALATDTRALTRADGQRLLFVALKGERFDGHDHVGKAAEAGVAAALVSRSVDVSIPQVVVGDTEHALAALARHLQSGRSTRVAALTGSNGKTSVKQILLSILSQVGGAYANPGNRNNEIGLPLAVIDAPEDAGLAVYEMGAGKPGDIAWLTAVVRPDVALVNNIAPAHLQRMGSLLGVAETKAAIYDALSEGGIGVVNADDAFAPWFEQRIAAANAGVLRFGLEGSAEIGARELRVDDRGARFTLVTPKGEVAVALPLPGRHNVRNALAATGLALALADVPLRAIADGLAAVVPVKGRLGRYRLGNGALLIDDSYNANPGSLAAAIDTLVSGDGERWLVLGDMGELGGDEAALHAEAGRRARMSGVGRLYLLGTLTAHAAEAFGDGARRFSDHAELTQALQADIAAQGEGTARLRLLIKGSRSSAMERITTALLDNGEAAANVA